MKTCTVVDVACDILVTIETERSLLSSVEELVAGRTLRFDISMALYNFAGHDQRLNGLSITSVTYETPKHHNKSG